MTGSNLAVTFAEGSDERILYVDADLRGLSGIAAAYYFLLHDTREKSPMLVNLLHFKGAFNG